MAHEDKESMTHSYLLLLQVVYMRYPNGIRDKSNWLVVLPNKPRHKLNNEFTSPIVFQEKYVFHVTLVNETIHTTLLNEEDNIEKVNEDDANEGN